MEANPQLVIPSELRPDLVGSTAAARILGTTVASVCRYVTTGYLPTVHRVDGPGFGGHVFDRATVEALAEARAQARAILDWHSTAWRDVIDLDAEAVPA